LHLSPVGREILAYMSAKVMSKSNNTKAMIVTTSSSQELSDNYMREYMMARYGYRTKEAEEIRCLPPIGKKIFWYVYDVDALQELHRAAYFPFVFTESHFQELACSHLLTIT
jgi:hypothetical protein